MQKYAPGSSAAGLSMTRFALVASLFFLSGCAVTQPTPGEPGPPPEPKKLARPDELRFLRARPAESRPRARIVFIGVYGGDIPSWESARYFIPQDWPPYRDARREDELGRIAYHDSLMHVLALEISRRFPESIALMIRGDAEVVADVAEYLYTSGDKLYLVGHSQGGAVVGAAAHTLKKAGVPIEMMAEMEGFMAGETVPANVRRAFNFYVPAAFSLCPGRVNLVAEEPAATRVTNVPIENPRGPFTGFCAAHRNIDSDPRVWKPVLDYIIASAGS
jgi:hypothetical protein